MATLYDELGGASAIETAVDLFYRRMLLDERVANFFDDVDMVQQIAKQQAFLTMVLGGPNHYTGRDLREGHKHLLKRGLNDSHVDIVIQHLGDTLRDLGVDEERIARVADLANSVRDDVLNRAAPVA